MAERADVSERCVSMCLQNETRLVTTVRCRGCYCTAGIHNVSYPRIDPSVICAVVSTDNERCLLVRKAVFLPQMYSLVAGFTDAGKLHVSFVCITAVQATHTNRCETNINVSVV